MKDIIDLTIRAAQEMVGGYIIDAFADLRRTLPATATAGEALDRAEARVRGLYGAVGITFSPPCACPESHPRHEGRDCGLLADPACAEKLCFDCCRWAHECVVCHARFHDEHHPHLNAACTGAPCLA